MEKAASIDANLHRLSLALPDEKNPKQQPKSIWEKTKIIFSNITVEPVMMCYILPSVMASLAVQNLNLEKSCRVTLQLNDTICDALTARNATGYEHHHEALVQKQVASMNAWKNVIQSLLPAILLMFIGSWSDRHNRRKPCLTLPLIGEFLSCVGFLLCAYFFYQLPMEANALAEAVPPSVTGGWFCMFMGVFSYISSITTEEMRTLRIGAVSMFSNGSFVVGSALSGILYRHLGFYGVFLLAISIYMVGITYSIFAVKEAPLSQEALKEADVDESKPKNFFADFFNVYHISETFKVAFKTGTRNRKKRICVIMILVMVIIGPMHGEFNVLYLYVRYKYGWDEVDYAVYQTFNVIFHMFGTLFALMFFSKFLKLDDTILGVISSLSKIASAIVFAFAPTPFFFYIGAIVEMFNGTSFIAMRSIASKLVPPEELGKINSLFGVSEALMPLVYGPMYNIVYRLTIKAFPGSFYLLGGVLTIPAVLIFIWLYNEHKKDEREEEMNKKQEEKLLNK